MTESYHQFFMLNGMITSTEKFDDSQINNGISFYEVIRIMNDRCLFSEDHMERLKQSVEIYGLKYPVNIKQIKKDILKFKAEIKLKEGNIKAVLSFKDYSDNNPQVLIYQIKHYYPVKSDYTNGVTLILTNAERGNPNSKIINKSIKNITSDKLSQTKHFETLLVNNKNQITEGSRSNIFFIKSDKLFTSPDSEVLCGITRKHLLDICIALQITVMFESVHTTNLKEFDAAFLTGTSIKILPVSQIEDVKFNLQNSLMRDLMKSFDLLIEKYLKS